MGALAERGQPGEREGRMAIGVAPGLVMVADHDAVEPIALGLDGELHQLPRPELLGRCLVAKRQSHTGSSFALSSCGRQVIAYTVSSLQMPKASTSAGREHCDR